MNSEALAAVRPGDGDRDLDIVYFDAGSGHRSSAIGLGRALGSAAGARARTVDVLEVIAGHRLFHATVRRGIDHFNDRLRREKVFDLRGLINLSLLGHDLVSGEGVRKIASFWEKDPPRAVVSVTPMYNGVLSRAFHHARPGAPFVVIPVDFEEGKRRYWFERKADLTYVLTTPRQREQARARGIPEERLHLAAGMIVDPDFYAPPPPDRTAALARLGLDPARSTILISFGGQGSVLVEVCARSLETVSRPLNVVVLCGRDEALRQRVSAAPSRHRRLVLGFMPEPPVEYHHLADCLIGKPGSMTITEGVVTGTPVLAIRSRGMRTVQGGNERWLEAAGAGRVLPNPAQIPLVLDDILDDEDRPARLRALRHDGVFSAAGLVANLAGLPAPHPTPS